MSDVLLEMRDISKSFPGVRALNRVSLACVRGEVHALVGENGAGKSTLMKILAGALQPDEGTIWWRGQPVQLRDPHTAQRLGISTIYQEFNLLPFLSVAENITLGREPYGRLGWLDRAQRDRLARQALESLGAGIDIQQLVFRLSVAQQQLVEIARALSLNAELIIMDEPSAALTGSELERLFEIIATLKARGVSVIYVSHRLEEIFRIADRVTVLKDGAHVGTLRVDEATEAQIIRMMVGRELSQMYPPRAAGVGEVVLEVCGLTLDSRVQDVSFQLRAGEIVGVAGLIGSGRTDLARALFGAEPAPTGEVLMRGKRLAPASPAHAIRAGLGYVTEDRKAEGLVMGLSVRENIALPSLDERQRLGFVRDDLERAAVSRSVAELQIRAPGIEQPVQHLSGGNQQKTVLAKWLAMQSDSGRPAGPAVILFDEPTRGIDVGAKAEIYALMRSLANQGKAILMISSELPEILGMSDRILVMRDGRVVGELAAGEATEEKIVTLAAGSAVNVRRNGLESGGENPRPTAATGRGPTATWLAEHQGVVVVYAVLAALVIFGMSVSSSFRGAGNLFSILRQATALGMVSVGQTLIVLAGGIDLSVSSIITLSGLFSAGLIQNQVGLILPVVLLCLGLGIVFGLVNGSTWVRLGVEPFIVTLGTLSIGRGLALVYARGPVGAVPPIYQAFAYADLGPMPVAVIFFALLLMASWLILNRTKFGRHLYAVGGNPEAARLAGIAVQRVKVWAFVLSGLAAAVTGLYMSSRMGSGDPNVGPGFELDSITAVVVGGTVLGGGRGGLAGTLGGVLLVAVLSNLLNLMNVDNWYQQIIKGVILLVAVATYRQRR